MLLVAQASQEQLSIGSRKKISHPPTSIFWGYNSGPSKSVDARAQTCAIYGSQAKAAERRVPGGLASTDPLQLAPGGASQDPLELAPVYAPVATAPGRVAAHYTTT